MNQASDVHQTPLAAPSTSADRVPRRPSTLPKAIASAPANMRLSRAKAGVAAVVTLLGLTSVGCGPERIEPDDFPRREREEVIVSSAEPEADAPTARSAEPNTGTGRGDALLDAAMRGELDSVKEIASSGTDIDATGEGGRTALQLAAYDGHLETVEWLIDQHAEIDHRDEFGRTALMYAATGDNASTVKALLAAGADMELVDEDEHFNALMFAAAEGQTKVVQLLLDKGADPSVEDVDGESALDFAKANGHADVVELLDQ
ncbi:ankyrin repeat domain-containing protein [Rhodopirellula sallentina]|uniref:Fibronectin type 3 and ankyrin repeat domain protein 1 n=1 Tax=Rhodopirellula sallentina SM41 TaxID=1263870 RepID=M5U2U4_9BACT|nr:ankyrin repeat domain-containing protein [Rhodopirellula sallentina]EMI55755.1 fibronectin type 3 and ankyrin repeat domain protein 1 [Rhodopirellula sallentina SM41]